MIDIAKGHTTKKKHADVGMRVCDYPTIQDYFGEAISDTNASRMMTYGMGQALDSVRSEEHTSELQSLMRISYAVFCLKKKKTQTKKSQTQHNRHNYNPPNQI